MRFVDSCVTPFGENKMSLCNVISYQKLIINIITNYFYCVILNMTRNAIILVNIILKFEGNMRWFFS